MSIPSNQPRKVAVETWADGSSGAIHDPITNLCLATTLCLNVLVIS